MRVGSLLDWMIGRVPVPDAAEAQRMLAEAALPGGPAPWSNPTSVRDLALMMSWHGVDPERIPLGWLGPVRDAERVCAACADTARCHAWMARPGADDPARFCPNHATLRDLAATQGEAG